MIKALFTYIIFFVAWDFETRSSDYSLNPGCPTTESYIDTFNTRPDTVFATVAGSTTVQAQGNSPQQLANKIANKMKDTLGLSEPQRNHIYTINMQLHVKKKNSPGHFYHQDTTSVHSIKLEKLRDDLYKGVLTPSQYILYRQKKQQLVFNN